MVYCPVLVTSVAIYFRWKSFVRKIVAVAFKALCCRDGHCSDKIKFCSRWVVVRRRHRFTGKNRQRRLRRRNEISYGKDEKISFIYRLERFCAAGKYVWIRQFTTLTVPSLKISKTGNVATVLEHLMGSILEGLPIFTRTSQLQPNPELVNPPFADIIVIFNSEDEHLQIRQVKAEYKASVDHFKRPKACKRNSNNRCTPPVSNSSCAAPVLDVTATFLTVMREEHCIVTTAAVDILQSWLKISNLVEFGCPNNNKSIRFFFVWMIQRKLAHAVQVLYIFPGLSRRMHSGQ